MLRKTENSPRLHKMLNRSDLFMNKLHEKVFNIPAAYVIFYTYWLFLSSYQASIVRKAHNWDILGFSTKFATEKVSHVNKPALSPYQLQPAVVHMQFKCPACRFSINLSRRYVNSFFCCKFSKFMRAGRANRHVFRLEGKRHEKKNCS